MAQVATGRVGSAAGGLVLIALTATAGWSAAIVVADHPLKRELPTGLRLVRTAVSTLIRRLIRM